MSQRSNIHRTESKEELERIDEVFLPPVRQERANSGHVTMNSIPPGNMLFAIPKKGRLYEKVLKLLDGIGIRFTRKARLDIAHSSNMNISLVFLPAKDIATFVALGDVDLGITGEDIVAEQQADGKVIVESKLEMGKCRLCLQAPNHLLDNPPEWFSGKRIVTSFPTLTKTFFDKLDAKTGRTTSIQSISGSVEAACGLGLADAVVDLVETGTTMLAAGLDVVDTVMSTETILISNPRSHHKRLVKQLVVRLHGWMAAAKHVMVTYNCPVEKLTNAKLITPGLQSPTVMHLADEGWVSVSVLVIKKELAGKMDALTELGCTGIVAFQMMNCRP